MSFDDYEDELDDAVGKPRVARVDQQSAEQHSLPDLIAADRYKNAKEAYKNKVPFVAIQISPPGAD